MASANDRTAGTLSLSKASRAWNKARRALQSPAGLTVVAAFVVLLCTLVIAIAPTGKGDRGERFLSGPGWPIWVGVAAVSVGLWLALLVQGWLVFSELAKDEELTGRKSRARSDKVKLLLAGIAFLVVIAIALWFISGGRTIDVPIEHWPVFTRALLGIAALSGLPWLMTVWLIHGAIFNVCRKATEFERGVPDSWTRKQLIYKYTSLWDRIQGSVLALAAIVTPAVLTTGALRLAVVPDYVKKEDFPANSVLLYGAFFAVFVAGAVLPMIGSWRSNGHRIVGILEPLPEDGSLSDDFKSARTRLETYLHLDVGFLKSPITTLSILAPFATAVLTSLATPK